MGDSRPPPPSPRAICLGTRCRHFPNPCWGLAAGGQRGQGKPTSFTFLEKFPLGGISWSCDKGPSFKFRRWRGQESPGRRRSFRVEMELDGRRGGGDRRTRPPTLAPGGSLHLAEGQAGS